MGGGQGPNPVKGEQTLHIEGLLRPEGAVVVEGGDALGWWHEPGRPRDGDRVHKRGDRPFARTLSSGGQGIAAEGLHPAGKEQGQRQEQQAGRLQPDHPAVRHRGEQEFPCWQLNRGSQPNQKPARQSRAGEIDQLE